MKQYNIEFVSYDDFYLTRKEQEALGDSNFFLSGRGVAGTHDLKLGTDTLRQLKTKRTGNISIPVYDKSAFGGKGDQGKPREAQAPVDLIIFEGWMLGYQPVSSEEATRLDGKYPGML